MNKRDIAIELSTKMDLSVSEAYQVVNHVVDIITHSLAEGNPIYLRGLATIKVVDRKSTKAYNFQSGETINIPVVRKLHISTSNRIKHALNSKG